MTPETLSFDAPLQRNPDLIATDMDGDLVMMSIERGEYFGIGGIGPHLWALLQTPKSPRQLCEAVLAEYDIDEATCRADVQRFVAELSAKGIVSPC